MKGVLRNCAALLAAALLMLGAAAETAYSEEEVGFTPIPVIKGIKLLPQGTPAPTFKVRDIEGKEFDFSTRQKKKAHLLVFWSIFCEPCREEMPIIEEVYHEFKDKNVDVLAVNLDGEPFLDGIRGFIKQYNYSFSVLLDELDEDNFRIADPYQVAGTPVLYLLDAHGQVYAGHLGRITVKDLRAIINEMLEKG